MLISAKAFTCDLPIVTTTQTTMILRLMSNKHQSQTRYMTHHCYLKGLCSREINLHVFTLPRWKLINGIWRIFPDLTSIFKKKNNIPKIFVPIFQQIMQPNHFLSQSTVHSRKNMESCSIQRFHLCMRFFITSNDHIDRLEQEKWMYCLRTGHCFQYSYRNSHYKDKMVWEPSS